MIKNFKKELNLIGNNKRITEKLMVIAIYNEFYNDVMDSINNDETKEAYSAFLEKAFDATIRYFNSNKTRNVNAGRFMSVYFNIIRKNENFKRQPLNQIVSNIENQLSNYDDVMDFVNIIDGFDELILERKVSILVQYREYANDILNSINEMFGFGTSKGNELRFSVLSVLKKRLDSYLKYCKNKNISPCNIANSLTINLIEPVKMLLLQKVVNCSLGVEDIRDDQTWEFLNEFQELEQDIWLMELVYEITGCNKNAKALKLNKPKEICESLRISKLRYTLTNVSIGLRSINVINKTNYPTRR